MSLDCKHPAVQYICGNDTGTLGLCRHCNQIVTTPRVIEPLDVIHLFDGHDAKTAEQLFPDLRR